MYSRYVGPAGWGLLASVWLGCASATATAADTVVASDGLAGMTLAEIRLELLAAPKEISAALLADKAKLGRYLTSVLVDRRVAEAARQAGLDNAPEVKARIARESRTQLVRYFLESTLAGSAAKVPALDRLARERYEVEKDMYKYPEAIRSAHILFRVDAEDERFSEGKARDEAEKVLAEMKNGGDFAALAKKYSADPGSAKNGGELPGWAERGHLVPPYEKAAYTLKPGEVSGLVRSRFGYHIIKLIDYRPAGVRPYEEVKAQIEQKIRSDFTAQQRNDLISAYQGHHEVELDDAAMQALRGP